MVMEEKYSCLKMQLQKFLRVGIASMWNFVLDTLKKDLIGPVVATVGKGSFRIMGSCGLLINIVAH